MGSIRDHVRYCRLPASRALDSCRRISGSGRHCPESDDEHLLSYYGVAREYLPSEIGPPILIWPRFPAMARDLLVQYGHQSNPQACLVRKVLFLDLDEEVDCTNVSTADKMNYDWAAAQHGGKKKRPAAVRNWRSDPYRTSGPQVCDTSLLRRRRSRCDAPRVRLPCRPAQRSGASGIHRAESMDKRD